MWSVKEGSTSDDCPAPKKLDSKVDVQQLLDFIFPKSLQHPLSTGRLFAFAMYGPLDSNANLRSGHNGHRVVSTWEIDTMCLQFEREDLLQVGCCLTGKSKIAADLNLRINVPRVVVLILHRHHILFISVADDKILSHSNLYSEYCRAEVDFERTVDDTYHSSSSDRTTSLSKS